MGITQNDIEVTELDYIGTIFYEVTLDQLQDYYRNDKNIVTKYIVETYGFDAFNLDLMFGSAIVNGNLYVCVSSGDDIVDIDGEETEAEQALEIYDIQTLDDNGYIEPATDEIIKKYVSSYDFDLTKIDLDDVAYELLSDGHHFSTIVNDAKDIDLLDDILY